MFILEERSDFLAVFSEQILLFTCYAWMGWLCESIFCSICAKHWINRGFLHGPFCPVYAVGALLSIYFLTPVSENWLLVFLLGTLITSAVEYFTGWLLETLFHAKWWDYSNHRFHLHGRICLENCLIFGLMCLFLMEVLHPRVLFLIHLIPPGIISWISAVLVVYFAVDTFFSARNALRIRGKIEVLQGILDEIRLQVHLAKDDMIDNLQEKLETLDNDNRQRAADLIARKNNAEKDLSALSNRIFKAFPKIQMQLPNAREALDQLRKTLRRP